MARSNGKRGAKRNKNEVSNVRVVDPHQGLDGARMDRILGQMQNSHSQIRVICGESRQLNSATTGAGGTVSGVDVRTWDDFQSFSAQFETYRIAAIRFEVYDFNPANVVVAVFSTQHDVVPSPLSLTAPTFANVIDGPDSQVVPPGSGKVVFDWFAHGSAENEFQSDTVNPINDYGGLRFYLNQAAAASGKYLIVSKAVVDFRGRI
jgi:hypothetical protein